MHVDDKTHLGALLSRHPDVEEVLEWYGFDLDNRAVTLAELCAEEGLDVRDVITDIRAALAEEEDGEDEEDWDSRHTA